MLLFTHTKPKTILIVDDEPAILDLVTSYVSLVHKENFDLQKAQNGKEALEIVTAQKPDLIFLDLLMPILDGFAVCEAIKGDTELADIPIVIMSAYYSEENINKATSCGANMFLKKPFDLKEILTAIDTFLNPKTSQ
jgi:two-component system alkaline phosphatase synthesis response regulator PhoP